jgi:hypothetical protein
MRILKRLLQRLVIFGLGVFSVWLIVFVIFEDADRRLPLIWAVAVTYGLSAYVILPRVVRMGLKLLHRRLIPSYTITGDGLPGDPVNIVLIGTAAQLRSAFEAAGWFPAEPLGLASSWRMVRAFLLNKPYPRAPFSTLYLFGRGQDIGFQQPIGDSPRKRHHIRFWGLGLEHETEDTSSMDFWLNRDRPAPDAMALWVGAGTRDTGFSLAHLTFQITHATDADTNAERAYIIGELSKRGVIADISEHSAGAALRPAHVNRYITDGEIVFARLTDRAPAEATLPLR